MENNQAEQPEQTEEMKYAIAKYREEEAERAEQQRNFEIMAAELKREKEVNKRLSAKVGELTAESLRASVSAENVSELAHKLVKERDELQRQLNYAQQPTEEQPTEEEQS